MHEQTSEAPGRRHSSDAGRGQAAQRLGTFLCWAVVFADIGTSVYYTPGILFQQPGVGPHAALFVAMTLLVFVLLTVKYAEVTIRYPEGGGVVTVTTSALNPFAGLIGGLFILVDYFLTQALSGLSGFIYLSDVGPVLKSLVLPVTLLALVMLAVLNLIGVKTSARVNAVFATTAAASQLAVVLAVIVQVGPAYLLAALPRVLSGPHLTPLRILTGYAGAFLAFSGLESIAQLAPEMAEPRRRVARRAMMALVVTMTLTSPLLTLWSTTLLPITPHTDPNQFISLLAGYVSGRPLEIEVAISGALLLVFASNTALIGAYHVIIALARQGFLPQVITRRNRWRDTPHWAILGAVAVPLLVLILARGSVVVLGDLYAFGLLGAFSLTCLSLDIVRWHERHPEPRTAGGRERRQERATGAGIGPVGTVTFALGVLTTALVTLAWVTNLFAKPYATLFGGTVTLIGLAIGLVTYRLEHRRGKMRVFPQMYREGYPVHFLAHGRRARPPATVLAVLPAHAEQIGALVEAANAAAGGGPVIFVRRGTHDPPNVAPRLFEIVDPYLHDPQAQAAFALAERAARRQGWTHRYLYLPATAGPDALVRYWHALRPAETLVAAGEEGILSCIPATQVRRSVVGTVPILHYIIEVPAEARAAPSL